MFHALIAVPFGWLPFAVLVLRELDESFTNVYSTAVSVQNLRPLADRRVLAVVVGAIATIGALALEHRRLPELPLPDRLGVRPDVRRLRGGLFPARWPGPVEHRRESRPARWSMLVPWALGFIAYQLVNPGGTLVVGARLAARSNVAALHPADLDERIGPVVRRSPRWRPPVRGAQSAGRRAKSANAARLASDSPLLTRQAHSRRIEEPKPS